MTIFQIFAHLNTLNAEVALCRSNYTYCDADERWACSITLEHQNSELKIRAKASDGDAALILAYDKLLPLLSSSQVSTTFGVPALPSPNSLYEETPVGLS